MRIERIAFVLLSTLSLKAESNYEVDGYVRGTYQYHEVKEDRVYQDDAVGGKIHFETAEREGLSVGGSLYGTQALFHEDNRGLVSLRGENHKSYYIIGEAYLKSKFGKTLLNVGRQEIETPFAQVDDIGMVPNTFEALTLMNHDIKNTTLFFGHIEKMSGVDSEVIDSFTKVNGSKGMQVVGVNYDGIEHLSLSGWYYRLKGAEIDKISYLEANYEGDIGNYGYGLGVQYAKEGASTKVMGATASILVKKIGLNLTTSYNKTEDGSAFSGFGGGPFFSNSEYLIIDNAGDNGKAKSIGVEFDASLLGMSGLNLGLGKITLETQADGKATETDVVASYEMNKEMEIHLVYSDLKGVHVGEDDAKHLRVYANYNF